MLTILVLLTTICLLYVVDKIYSPSSMIKAIVISLSYYVFFYVITSGLYFIFDAFSFKRVLVTLLVFYIVLLVCHVIKYKKIDFHINFRGSINVIEILLVFMVIFLTASKFELYDNDQDQGLYQAEALELYMGNYEVEHDFEEYGLLTNPEDKASYYEMLDKTIVGYYPLSASPIVTFDETARKSDVSGMYHGVQTFPAILALGAKLFGLENMVQIQSVFFVCAVLLIYYAMCNMGMKLTVRLIALSIFVLSPLVIWISKSSFTEMFLTLCISFWLFQLTESGTRAKRFLLFMPLAAFSFVHMSFLELYPIFFLINIILYMNLGKKEYLWNNVFISVSLSLSYFMMERIAPQYFYHNCARLFSLNIITAENFLYWIYGGSTFGAIVSLLMGNISKRQEINHKFVACVRWMPVPILLLLGIILKDIILVGYFYSPDLEGRFDLTCYYGKGFWESLGHSTLYAFALSSGILVVPFIIWQLLRRYNQYFKSVIEIIVSFLFIYCVLVEAAFLFKQVHYYYYYSRYLVMYIPVICLTLAIILSKNALKRTACFSLIIPSLCCMFLFDVALLLQKDLTKFEWENLIDLSNIIQEDSAVIMDSEMAALLGPQLRTLANTNIFPIFKDVEKEIELLDSNYSNVYYLTGNSFGDYELNGFEVVYKDKYIYQNETAYGRIIYPMKYTSISKDIVLFQYGMIGPNTIELERLNVGVINGVKENGYIISTGDAGLVMFGPYINLGVGQYCLHIPIEVINQQKSSLGTIYIGNVDLGADSVLPETPLENFMIQEGENFYLKVPFAVGQYTKNMEIIVTATEESVFKIYNYDIYQYVK